MSAAYLTPREVAERWRPSVRHINRMAQTGRIPAVRIEGGWRFSLASVTEYELAHTSGAASSTSDEGRKAEVVRPVFGVLDEATGPLVLPERWWESQPTTGAASSAAGRGRSTGKKKAALRGN
jgi:excisionase family DNA binding protein